MNTESLKQELTKYRGEIYKEFDDSTQQHTALEFLEKVDAIDLILEDL